MGFLKKFFSFGGRKGKKKTNLLQSHPYDYEHEINVHQPRNESDTDAAVSRLLRSSSSHFHVVSEVDYKALPPIPHPINTISRSSTMQSMLHTANVQTKNSYTVKVLQREQISRTEFPNANPPLRNSVCTPRRFDYNSTPNLHDISEPPRRRQISDPRKIPFTPRDQNRLNRLRQDPSVVSLLNMYDERGQIDDHAFSNTPPPPLPSAFTKRGRRESTFKELLGDSVDQEYAFEGDLSWAERCIAESVASTSSLSTVSSPVLETPTINAFESGANDNVDGTFSSESSTTYPAISSLEVELSSIMDDDDVPARDEANADITVAGTFASPRRIVRTPSQRASQVFNFLSEKRDRRKSQDLLASATQVDDTFRDIAHQCGDRGKDVYIHHTFNIPQILIDEYPASDVSANPLPANHLAALALPAPPSPIVFHPLQPAPRHKSRSTSATDVLSNDQQARDAKMRAPRRPARSSTGANVLLNDERERQREHALVGDHDAYVRSMRPVARVSVQQAKKGKDSIGTRPAFIEMTNEVAGTEAAGTDPYTPLPSRSSQRNSYSSKTRMDPSVSAVKGFSRMSHSRPPLHSIDALVPEKENGQALRVGTSANLARSATNTYEEKGAKSAVPLKPVRSRSLFDPPSPASSSELSPEAKQLMADVRAKKMKNKQAQRDNERRAMIALH